MNFKKLGSVITKRKVLVLSMSANGTQWAGDDFAFYELSGLPAFTIDTLLFTFGVDLAKKDAWVTREEGIDWRIDTSAENSSDIAVIIDDNTIRYKGTDFAILHVRDQCFVLPERYLSPIWSDQMQLFFRTMPKTGEAKIIAKEGMFVTAFFTTMKPSAEMAEWMVKTCNAIH